MRYFIVIVVSFWGVLASAQAKKIEIIHADNTLVDEMRYPDAIVSLGHVLLEHEGATLECKQALIYQKLNLVKAFGDVLINQGDTITQKSKYVDYNGNTKIAKSWGNVVLKDLKMILTTDTLQFDREKQLLYYDDFATIKDTTNTLTSQIGKYNLNTHKFQALSKVTITNPDQTTVSDHLDYYTDTGDTYLFGPSTIKDSINTLSFEKGYHDSKSKKSYFSKNAKIFYEDRIIEGDSMFYDEPKKFASSTGNIVVTDTINEVVVRGQYAEYFEALDSVFIIGKPFVESLVDKDSIYIHGDTLMFTGPTGQRIIRAFHHVKFFKTDLQGKCDSLFTDEQQGITKMYRKPAIWSDKNQITGDSIHLLSDVLTDKMDSIKVYNNSFIISQDSISGGFNQVKGRFIYAKFANDTLDNAFVDGNGQMIHYYRDDESMELIGITKEICSNIHIKLDKGDISSISFLVETDGKTYPPSKFPENEKKLQGFIWREEERPLTMQDIFKHDKGDDLLSSKVPIKKGSDSDESSEKRQSKTIKKRISPEEKDMPKKLNTKRKPQI